MFFQIPLGQWAGVCCLKVNLWSYLDLGAHPRLHHLIAIIDLSLQSDLFMCSAKYWLVSPLALIFCIYEASYG